MPTEVSGLIPLFLKVGPRPTGSIDLFAKGPGPGNTWEQQQHATWSGTDYVTWENWGNPPAASGINSGSINLYLLGDLTSPYSGNIPLYLRNTGTGTASGSMTLFEQTTEPFSGDLPLYLKGQDAPSASINLYAKGGATAASASSGIASGVINLYTSGYAITVNSGNIPLYMKVSSTGEITNNIPLVITGEQEVTSSMDLYLSNTYVEATATLYTRGYWTVFGNSGNRSYSKFPGASVPLRRAGGAINSAAVTSTATYNDLLENCGPLSSTCWDIPAEIFDEVLDSRDQVFSSSSRPGAIPATSNIPLYLHHTIGVTNRTLLFIEGVAWSENNMTLYVDGIQQASGTMTLYMSEPSGQSNNSIKMVTVGSAVGI